MKNDLINIIVISPQVMFRTGIEIILSSESAIKIIGSVDFSNGVEYSLENLSPDIAILDIDGSGTTGFDIAHTLKQRLPNITIIIFTSHTSEEQLFHALKAKASAYMSKESTAKEIIQTIRRLASVEYPINRSLHDRPVVAEQVLRQFQELSTQSEIGDLVSPLTSRETEILEYIAKGFLNKQIASELDISKHTIKSHVASILGKLNANARTEAVVVGIKRGIISLE